MSNTIMLFTENIACRRKAKLRGNALYSQNHSFFLWLLPSPYLYAISDGRCPLWHTGLARWRSLVKVTCLKAHQHRWRRRAASCMMSSLYVTSQRPASSWASQKLAIDRPLMHVQFFRLRLPDRRFLFITSWLLQDLPLVGCEPILKRVGL